MAEVICVSCHQPSRAVVCVRCSNHEVKDYRRRLQAAGKKIEDLEGQVRLLTENLSGVQENRK